MLRIWGRTNSINVQKVLWCCDELSLGYERIDAGMQFGVVDTPEYRAKNPNALVPTIEDDGFVLWESNTIVRYLAQRHGTGTLCPTDLRTRFSSEKWMDWQATTLWPVFRTVFMGLVRTPAEKRDNKAISAAFSETARLLKALERQLSETRFVSGGELTIGDIPVGAAIHRCFALGIERDDFPALSRWYDELTQRQGFRANVMLPLS
jgi:glutathione S-transferase